MVYFNFLRPVKLSLNTSTTIRLNTATHVKSFLYPVMHPGIKISFVLQKS
jgi:hypothetical protein